MVVYAFGGLELSPDRKENNPKLGPHGLGDPNDRSLRKVELDVLIPKKMREKSRLEKCIAEVADFNKCCKDNGLGMIIGCRKESKIMKECYTTWFRDPEFKKECTEEYLKERSEYRRTGIRQQHKHR